MTRGWWGMCCWNGLTPELQDRLINVGNLPLGALRELEYAGHPFGCERPASVAVECESDAAPGPRFYCAKCAIDYLTSLL